LDAPVDRADLEEVLGNEIDVGEIAVWPCHAQLVGFGTVDILGAEVIERVALDLVVDQRAGEIHRVFAEALRVIDGQLLRILTTLKRIDLPSLRAVIRLDLGEALEERLIAYRSGPLDQCNISQLER